MNDNSQPGSRLRTQREARHLSQDVLAKQCGVSREMWGKYERGLAVPGGEVLAAAAHAGIDVMYVLTGDTAEQRVINDVVRGATIGVAAIHGTDEQRAALRDADALQRLDALFPIDALEANLLANYRACEVQDRAILMTLAARFAATPKSEVTEAKPKKAAPKRPRKPKEK